MFEELEKTELLVKKLKYSAWIQKFSLRGIAAILTFFNVYLILKKVISVFFWREKIDTQSFALFLNIDRNRIYDIS